VKTETLYPKCFSYVSSVRGLLLCALFFTMSTDKNRSHRFVTGERAGHNPLLILVSPQSLNNAQNWSRREVLHHLALKEEMKKSKLPRVPLGFKNRVKMCGTCRCVIMVQEKIGWMILVASKAHHTRTIR